jgi:2-C-methyl-D-erythritol 4-phosphate cytidylyltransferase
VAVHDGARPLIDPSQITRCIHKAADTGAAATARRVTETLKRANPDGQVLESIDREGVWVMETPQVFRLSLLRAAYAEIIDSGASVTDEVSAVERAGCAVWLVENFTPNPKITLPGDLETAERLLR